MRKRVDSACQIIGYYLFGIHICVVTLQVDGNCYDLVQVQLLGNFSNQTTTFGPVIPNVTDAGSVEVIIADNITTNEVYNVTVSDEQIPEITEETSLSEFPEFNRMNL